MRSKGRNFKILAVMPGPSIQSNMRPYLRKTVMAFRRFGLEVEGGLQVSVTEFCSCDCINVHCRVAHGVHWLCHQ